MTTLLRGAITTTPPRPPANAELGMRMSPTAARTRRGHAGFMASSYRRGVAMSSRVAVLDLPKLAAERLCGSDQLRPPGLMAALPVWPRGDAERARRLVGHQDAVERGGQHRRRARVAQGRGQGRAERGGVLWVLEHERRLEVDVRVKAGGQPEVAVHERAGLLVELERLLFGHSSSFRIAAAASAGSGAAVIGRPTTT